jgi:hypothetical protein
LLGIELESRSSTLERLFSWLWRLAHNLRQYPYHDRASDPHRAR